MVVLSDDVFQTEAHAIKDIRVEQTILGGRVVYDRNA
jgi:predicted amidohydrolase YtcJ